MAYNVCKANLGDLHLPDFHDWLVSPEEGTHFILTDGSSLVRNVHLVYIHVEDVWAT